MASRTHQTLQPRRRPPPSHHVVYALLWLDSPSAHALRTALEEAGLHPPSLLSRFHLTVYHARRFNPGLRPTRRAVSIDCDLAETRTMVLVPGGENPRPGVTPSRHSLALRLTTRNSAISEIQALRAELTQMETDDVIGTRARSTRNRNAFGARYYQPHLKICEPRNGAPPNLAEFGRALRARAGRRPFRLLRSSDDSPCGPVEFSMTPRRRLHAASPPPQSIACAPYSTRRAYLSALSRGGLNRSGCSRVCSVRVPAAVIGVENGVSPIVSVSAASPPLDGKAARTHAFPSDAYRSGAVVTTMLPT